jgi:hypothetical protein
MTTKPDGWIVRSNTQEPDSTAGAKPPLPRQSAGSGAGPASQNVIVGASSEAWGGTVKRNVPTSVDEP